MSWKNSFGQLIGIFVGVTLGMGVVNYAIYSFRGQPQPVPTEEQYTYSRQEVKMGVFDQVVSNVTPR